MISNSYVHGAKKFLKSSKLKPLVWIVRMIFYRGVLFIVKEIINYFRINNDI